MNKLNELDLANLTSQQVDKLKKIEQESEFHDVYLIAVKNPS